MTPANRRDQMKNLMTLSLGILAIGAALGLASAVKAQDTPAASTPPSATEHGAMGGHMPDMTARMNRMMDQCERMMRSKDKK
jgi:hypothetical protein